MKNNTEKVNDFIRHSQDFISTCRNSAFSIEKQEKNISFYHYNENGNLISIGNSEGDANKKRGIYTAQ